MPKLDDYEAKRDFSRTPEPSGRRTTHRAKGASRFVVQEHHARSLHWDLRLEHEGVLASWAVPKGIPPDPSANHLAVRTEDHPMEYLDFQGTIPAGEYGAGTMTVWDTGTYDVQKWEPKKVEVTLHGERVQGRYALFQTGGRNWMIHRMDPPADPARVPPPTELRPMLATPSTELPSGRGWHFEMKWDGIRVLALVEGGRVQLTSRNGNDLTSAFPELRALGEELGSTEALLDGEIVALDDDGRASFQRLQPRMHVRDASAARRLAREVPIVFMVFDVLWLDGRMVTDLPYTERRRLLDRLALRGRAWQTPPASADNGDVALATSRKLGFEGLVAKRSDSPYEAGRRSRCWFKVKHQLRQEFVVGGWQSGKGARAERIGALLLGYYENGVVQYAGKVGTGFTDAELTRVARLLEPLATNENPFTGRGVPRDARFVRPELVAEVRFTEWTDAGHVRQPAYLGLRPDKAADEVVRE